MAEQRTVDLSVATLVRNRNDLLGRLVEGLASGEAVPAQLLVAWCGGEDPRPVLRRRLPFAVDVLDIGGGDRIPYSVARNRCARRARSSAVAFLDADCIPSPGYAGSLAAALAGADVLATGEVLYLPPDVPAAADETTLRACARPHPHRKRPPAEGVDRAVRHEMIWGLHLALRRRTFLRLGGFDESYGGYAGEDTDLAITARQAGIPAALVADADIFHQHHDVWEPPLQQMEATLANASRFRSKWGWWPMDGWLREMADLGFIIWSPEARAVRIVRFPDAADLAAARHREALPFRI